MLTITGHPSQREVIIIDYNHIMRWSLQSTEAQILAQVHCPSTKVSVLATAPDGNYFAVSYDTSTDPLAADSSTQITECHLEIHSWHDLKMVQSITFPGYNTSLTAIEFSPDRYWIAAATIDGDIYLIDRERGSIVQRIETDYYVSALLFDPSSSHLVVAATDLEDGFIRLYGLENGHLRSIQDNFTSSNTMRNTPASLAFSPDGRLLAVYCGTAEVISVYNFQTRQKLWSITRHTQLTDGSQINAEKAYFFPNIAFVAEGTHLVCGDGSGDALLLASNDGHLIQRCPTGSRTPLDIFLIEPGNLAIWRISRDIDSHSRRAYKFLRASIIPRTRVLV